MTSLCAPCAWALICYCKMMAVVVQTMTFVSQMPCMQVAQPHPCTGAVKCRTNCSTTSSPQYYKGCLLFLLAGALPSGCA